MIVELRTGYVRLAGWQRVTRGVHRPVDADEVRDRLAGWQCALPPGAAFTGLTGALLRGWWLPPLPADVPVFVVTTDGESRPRRRGLLAQRRSRPVTGEIISGMRVAAASEVLLSAARDLRLLDLVVLVDAALHRGDCGLPELRVAAAEHCSGAPALRRALRYVDTRSESPWETVLRLLLVTCEVPVEPQYVVRDDLGAFVARADLRITGTRRLMEYDGGVHRDPRQQAEDLGRDRILLRSGWQRFGYTSAAVLHNARSILLDADQALGRPHHPERIRAWHRLLAESAFTPAGRARLAARWRAAGYQPPTTLDPGRPRPDRPPADFRAVTARWTDARMG